MSLKTAPREVGHWNMLGGHSTLRMRLGAAGLDVGSGISTAAVNVVWHPARISNPKRCWVMVG